MLKDVDAETSTLFDVNLDNVNWHTLYALENPLDAENGVPLFAYRIEDAFF